MPRLNDPEIEQVTQVESDALVYLMRDPTGSEIDASMGYSDFFKWRTGELNVRDFAGLSAAVAEIGSDQATLVIPATVNVPSSLVIPENLTLIIVGEGAFNVSSGQTLTINSGNAGWPLRHIFTGSGTVRLGSNIEACYARWYGAKEDNVTDDAAAIQKALDAFGNATTFRAGRVRIVGGAAVGSTLTIASGSVILEGTGWGISIDGSPRGFLRWIGSAENEGEPMILVVDCVASGVANIRLIGDSDFKPSAAIEFRQTLGGPTTDQPYVDNVWIGAYYSADLDTGQQFEKGLLFTGAQNCDNGIFKNLHILLCSIGVDNQNPNASIHHYQGLSIAFCATGFKTVAPQTVITNFGTGANDIDIDFASGNLTMQIYNYICEGSGRMVTASAGSGRITLKVDGGAFSCVGEDLGGKFDGDDFDGKRFFIDFSGTRAAALSLTLVNFDITGFGDHASPAVRAWNTSDNVTADGETAVTLLFHEVAGMTSDMFYIGNESIPHSKRILEFHPRPTSTGIGPQRTTFIYSSTDAEDRVFRDLYSYKLGGLTQYGGPFKVKRLATPSGVAATPTGGSGTPYSYRVVALSHDGHTLASDAATCSGGAVLSDSVYNTITVPPVVGAWAYEIYGRTSPEQLLITLTLAEIGDTFAISWRDTGALTPSGALPTANTTGNLAVYGHGRVYNTDDGAGNAEYIEAVWEANIARFRAAKTGSGTLRAIKIDSQDFAIQIAGADAWGVYVDKMLYPGADNQYNLGAGSFRIKEGYFGTGIVIGGTAIDSKAVLDLQSTAKGFLPPRMSTTQRDAITSPPAGLTIYNTTTNKLNFYNGSAWEAVTSA